MRGLETRLNFAKAKLHLAIDEHCMDANMEMLDALMGAKALGHADRASGIDAIPPSFKDARPLVCAWHVGVACAIETEKHANAASGNDDSNTPCFDSWLKGTPCT